MLSGLVVRSLRPGEMGRPIVASTSMLLSEPRFTDYEPATLDQGEQSGGAEHLAILALLLEAQRVDLRVYLLVVLPDLVRVGVNVVVHLLFLLPYSRLYRQGELWRATAGGGSAKTPIRGAYIAGEREWA